jgi:hypothetical protein
MNRLWPKCVLLFLVAAGVAIRCYDISGRSLWFDEAFSWRLVCYPLPQMLDRITQDVHPPLYYLGLKGWTAIWGASVTTMRLWSVLCGGLSIVGTYLFVAEAFRGDPTHDSTAPISLALFAAALVATSVFQVRYAWEIRMYAQGAALAAFSNWALCRALRPPAQARWWFVWALFATAFAYTHYFAFFTLAAQGLFSALNLMWPAAQPDRHTRLRTVSLAALAGMLVVGLYLPWVRPFLRQRAEVQESFWAGPIDRWTVPALLYQMLIGGPDTDTFDRGVEHGAIGVCAVLTALALVLLFAAGGASERFLVISSVLPVVLAVGVSLSSGRPIFTNRYFTFAQLSLLTALGALIWRIQSPALRHGAALLAVAGSIVVCARFVLLLNSPGRPGTRGVAELLVNHRTGDDPVIVGNSRVFLPLSYYTAVRAKPRLLNVPARIEHFGGRQVLDPGDMIELRELWEIPSGNIWIVHTSGFGGLQVPVPPQWVPAEVWSFPELFWWQGEIVVTRYELPRDHTPRAPPQEVIDELQPKPKVPAAG